MSASALPMLALQKVKIYRFTRSVEGSAIRELIVRWLPKPQSSAFICGCGHSGTTLLARIMAEHPDVFSVPYETAAFGNANRGQRWAKLAVLLIRARLSGKPLWVEKTPGHILHTDTISRVMPNAKFIVTTRDGRDTVASLGKRYGNFERAFKRWSKDSRASKLRIQNGSSFHWRYEDFIELPSRSIEDLCSFLGISYDGDLLDYHKKPTTWGQKPIRKLSEHSARRQAQVSQPIQDNRGKWKHELPPEVLSWFDHDDARELMEFFGYR